LDLRLSPIIISKAGICRPAAPRVLGLLPKCWGALIDPFADFGLNNLWMGNLQNGVSPTYPRALSIIMLGTGTSGTKRQRQLGG
jgi:hypothetical protein